MKPILFSTPMVQAVLDGTKNQTRRILKAPEDWQFKSLLQSAKPKIGLQAFGTLGDLDGLYGIKAAYIPGDILWVRESWNENIEYIPQIIGPDEKKSHGYFYKADIPDNLEINPKWKPSIHMPREAARLFLRVTNVRVERLQSISDLDSLNEGTPDEYYDMAEHYHNGGSPLRGGTVERCSFAMLWESINGYGSWDANPWVWVYEFERCEKPIN